MTVEQQLTEEQIKELANQELTRVGTTSLIRQPLRIITPQQEARNKELLDLYLSGYNILTNLAKEGKATQIQQIHIQILERLLEIYNQYVQRVNLLDPYIRRYENLHELSEILRLELYYQQTYDEKNDKRYLLKDENGNNIINEYYEKEKNRKIQVEELYATAEIGTTVLAEDKMNLFFQYNPFMPVSPFLIHAWNGIDIRRYEEKFHVYEAPNGVKTFKVYNPSEDPDVPANSPFNIMWAQMIEWHSKNEMKTEPFTPGFFDTFFRRAKLRYRHPNFIPLYDLEKFFYVNHLYEYSWVEVANEHNSYLENVYNDLFLFLGHLEDNLEKHPGEIPTNLFDTNLMYYFACYFTLHMNTIMTKKIEYKTKPFKDRIKELEEINKKLTKGEDDNNEENEQLEDDDELLNEYNKLAQSYNELQANFAEVNSRLEQLTNNVTLWNQKYHFIQQ
ncbi:hypothetical protein TRFO_13192 [Tritrichomonas foetus]|uniref:Uncharacterized protein n=1 Tax=Tritrichomonas foetus TaxID=1144522 RepID=A0A1J4KZR6_9EUKA|nr:hypothetical protein TRFO_13192 [Tritrichomonas foetus]|eukprot:OHT16360.1 hypothetical protein TRFO_13192 [Tritrichomonas foetus]